MRSKRHIAEDLLHAQTRTTSKRSESTPNDEIKQVKMQNLTIFYYCCHAISREHHKISREAQKPRAKLTELRAKNHLFMRNKIPARERIHLPREEILHRAKKEKLPREGSQSSRETFQSLREKPFRPAQNYRSSREKGLDSRKDRLDSLKHAKNEQ